MTDEYFTPDWVVRQCMKHVLPYVCPFPLSRIIDPGAGHGVFVRQLRAHYLNSHITAIDINHRFGPWPNADASVYGDYLDTNNERLDHFDLAVGNPPFSLAMQFVTRSLVLADTVVFLLRQGFLSSAKRNTFFRMRPPQHIFILAHRPCFYSYDPSTDKADYCFVCWGKPTGTTYLHWLPTIPVNERR